MILPHARATWERNSGSDITLWRWAKRATTLSSLSVLWLESLLPSSLECDGADKSALKTA
eukprot:CAMPEP_0171870934 /NCGR_PEP_ID=MMETSP0992-20121227/32918_1 /TAXON_ID=483369 /ORGANISM="non described non described, Strain CCMP2098" /LENGTH=59 /DNA_ID=CAMNT_0012495131 /DNA_START=120 /DNA_END=299 /DNA_ORIENTATION=+